MSSEVRVHQRIGDLDGSDRDLLIVEPRVAVDTETTGLDWSMDKLQLIQLHAPGTGETFLVRSPQVGAPVLGQVLHSDRSTKVFHHARFDLRFLRHQLHLDVRNCACTKVLGWLLDSDDKADHSLAGLAHRYLGVVLDKGQRRSDWGAIRLTPAQIEYAANDVAHLVPLLHALLDEAHRRDLSALVDDLFAFLPSRAELDLRGIDDPYRY